jgi:hypothetical protein
MQRIARTPSLWLHNKGNQKLQVFLGLPAKPAILQDARLSSTSPVFAGQATSGVTSLERKHFKSRCMITQKSHFPVIFAHPFPVLTVFDAHRSAGVRGRIMRRRR